MEGVDHVWAGRGTGWGGCCNSVVKPLHSSNNNNNKATTKKEEKKAYLRGSKESNTYIVQELCESRGGRPGMSVLTSILVSVDVKIY